MSNHAAIKALDHREDLLLWDPPRVLSGFSLRPHNAVIVCGTFCFLDLRTIFPGGCQVLPWLCLSVACLWRDSEFFMKGILLISFQLSREAERRLSIPQAHLPMLTARPGTANFTDSKDLPGAGVLGGGGAVLVGAASSAKGARRTRKSSEDSR